MQELQSASPAVEREASGPASPPRPAPVQAAPAAPAPPAEDGPSERVLVARLRRGDPRAFEAFIKAHQDRVFDFCFRMVGDREDASDLVQEIFVSIHQSLDKFRADAKLSTWVYRIAKNHCLNRLKYLKRRGRGRSEALGEVSEVALQEAIGAPEKPDDALQASLDRRLIQRAIAQLEEEQRVLVALRDIEGLSYDEIVEITELPEGTVKSRLHRARERLAEIVGRLEQ